MCGSRLSRYVVLCVCVCVCVSSLVCTTGDTNGDTVFFGRFRRRHPIPSITDPPSVPFAWFSCFLFAGVNARVSDAADWIDEMVCKLSLHPPRDFCPPPKGWGHWIIDATGFATGFVTALLLVGVLYCETTATARRRRLRNYGSWKGRWSCCGWWRSLQWAAAPDHQKLLPLKTDSSLSSSSDASSDTSYGSVGNVEVPEHPALAEVPS